MLIRSKDSFRSWIFNPQLLYHIKIFLLTSYCTQFIWIGKNMKHRGVTNNAWKSRGQKSMILRCYYQTKRPNILHYSHLNWDLQFSTSRFQILEDSVIRTLTSQTLKVRLCPSYEKHWRHFKYSLPCAFYMHFCILFELLCA